MIWENASFTKLSNPGRQSWMKYLRGEKFVQEGFAEKKYEKRFLYKKL